MAEVPGTSIGIVAEIEIAFASELDALASRAAQYSGSFWTAVWDGFGSAARDTELEIGAPVRVRRILDDFAEHCETCPRKEGTYNSWEDMLAVTGGVPADGSDDCQSNCRCRLQFEDPETGLWRSAFPDEF